MKSFDTWCYTVICATLFESFHKNRKQLMFFQNIFWSWKQSIQVRKKLFCRVIVNNCVCNFLYKFLIKIESTWWREIKEQTSEAFIKKLFLKISQYPPEILVLESLFKKVLYSKETSALVFSCKYCKTCVRKPKTD